MYGHGYRRHGWLPVVLVLLVALALFSGGFHHLWFIFGPLCFGLPFFLAGGIVFMFLSRRWHGGYPKFKRGEWFSEEKRKMRDDSGSDVFYV